jgi:hypothetical protein
LIPITPPFTADIVRSSKELAHFERIRDQFEQQDLSKPATTADANNTNGPSMPRLPLGMRQRSHEKHAQAPPPPSSTQLPIRPKLDGRTHTAIKGKSKGKGIANPDSGPDSDGDGDDDEYVIKTSHLNGNVNGNGNKGKVEMGDGFIEDGDEDLYP